MTNTIAFFITAVHLAALSQIESGDKDKSVGKAGEITRFQITPSVLHSNGFGTADVDDARSAAIVARRIWQARVDYFILSHLAKPTPEQLYLLWACPSRVFNPTPQKRERAQRFTNLVISFEQQSNKATKKP